MTLREFGRLFVQLGAHKALNLDGGGSSEMWVKGKVVNKPADGEERPICSAILVLPGDDKGESLRRDPGLYSAAADGGYWDVSAYKGSAASGSRAALEDPASTGGLADMMARKGLDLSPRMRRAASIFRSSR
jgi:hypothetical protein